MLDSEIEFYFKKYFTKPSIDFSWGDEDNNKLFEYLNNKFPKKILQETQSQLKIKQAFKDYFEPVGYIQFKISDNKIDLKIFPYKTKPQESSNLPFIIDILNNNEELIEYCYKGKSNQISISKELKNKIYDFINSLDNEEINKKELIRYAVSSFFELNDYDIVIIKDDQIFIKILEQGYKNKVADNEKNTIANRYNGINEDELKSIYDIFFSKEENKNVFCYVAKIFVQMYLIDEKIDNLTYEKRRFSYIQTILAEEINKSNDYKEDFCIGFSGYIFRIHFMEVFEYITDLILEEIAMSNEYLIDFLKYYSSNIIVLDGKKYKVPEIESENGLKWNVISMLSIVKIYIKTKNSIDTSKEKIAELTKKIEFLYINNISPLDYQNGLIKEQQKLEDDIVKDQRKIERLSDSLYISKNEDKKRLMQIEIQETKEQLQEKRERKKNLKSNALKQSVLTQYNNLKKEINTLSRGVFKEEKVLAQNEESFLLIKNALTRALTSKKTLVG